MLLCLIILATGYYLNTFILQSSMVDCLFSFSDLSEKDINRKRYAKKAEFLLPYHIDFSFFFTAIALSLIREFEVWVYGHFFLHRFSIRKMSLIIFLFMLYFFSSLCVATKIFHVEVSVKWESLF